MYELVIVSKISETEGLLSRVEKTLKDANATEVKIEKLGKKILAYPIKKQTEADYIMLNFEAEGKAIADISDMLRLEQEALLRHILLKKKIRKAPRRRHALKKVVEEKKVEVPIVTVVTTKVTSKVAKVSQPKAGRPLDEKVLGASRVTKAKIVKSDKKKAKIEKKEKK